MSQSRHYDGLTDAQVLESRREHGVNVLTPPKKRSMFMRFLEKFKDPLIIILLVAGALSIGIACYEYYALPDTGATAH